MKQSPRLGVPVGVGKRCGNAPNKFGLFLSHLYLDAGETKTEAVKQALSEKLERLQREDVGRSLANELASIARHCASLPVLDDRPMDEILGCATLTA